MHGQKNIETISLVETKFLHVRGPENIILVLQDESVSFKTQPFNPYLAENIFPTT